MRFRDRTDAGRRSARLPLCAEEPMSFYAVGRFYQRFDQTSDDEVLELLAQASARAEATT